MGFFQPLQLGQVQIYSVLALIITEASTLWVIERRLVVEGWFTIKVGCTFLKWMTALAVLTLPITEYTMVGKTWEVVEVRGSIKLVCLFLKKRLNL